MAILDWAWGVNRGEQSPAKVNKVQSVSRCLKAGKSLEKAGREWTQPVGFIGGYK